MKTVLAVLFFASMASHRCVFNAQVSAEASTAGHVVEPRTTTSVLSDSLSEAELSELRTADYRDLDSAHFQYDTASTTTPDREDKPETFSRRVTLTGGTHRPLLPGASPGAAAMGDGVFAPGPEGPVPVNVNTTEVDFDYLEHLEGLGNG